MTKKRRRVRLPKHCHKEAEIWEPRWEPEIRNWASKIINDNKWRYDPILEHDDLLQDAFIAFLRVKEAYPRVIDPPHFMALYKTTLMRQLCDEATKNIIRKEHEVIIYDDFEIFADSFIKELDNDGYLTILCDEAPADIKAVFELFLDNEKLERLRPTNNRPKFSYRETLNERLCSLIDTSCLTKSGRIRVRLKYDIVSRVKCWITEQTTGRKELQNYV